MFKVMIVDDEPMIRQGLQSLIDWESYQFEVCTSASNGIEALEKFNEYKPDLILLDIRMPMMDGLQTIHELRASGADCRILILSGYGEFEYAQKAIKYRIDGYVLKPIDEEELTEYVEKIKKDLLKRKREQELNSQSVQLLKDEWLKGLVNQQLVEAELSSEHWKILFQSEPKQIRLILIDTYSREHSLTITHQIKQQLSKLAKQQCLGEVFLCEAYIMILLQGIEMSSYKRERLTSMIEHSCGAQVYFVALMSDECNEPVSLYKQIAAIKQWLQQRFFLDENKLYELQQLEDFQKKQPSLDEASLAYPTEQAAQRLLYSIDVGNKELLANIIEEIDMELKELGMSEQQVKNSWAQLVTFVINRLSSLYPKQQFEQELKLVTQLYLAFHNHLMLNQLQEKLYAVIDRLKISDNSNTMVIKQMIDFIERHYMEPLRLETLSEIFNYNSGYLGKLFKNYTGESFNTYLDRVRIEHAIIGLQEGKKVHQVAEMVGYANVDYFHSKFKKYKGVSPSAFKPNASQKVYQKLT